MVSLAPKQQIYWANCLTQLLLKVQQQLADQTAGRTIHGIQAAAAVAAASWGLGCR
jgi:hypothetical protein